LAWSDLLPSATTQPVAPAPMPQDATARPPRVDPPAPEPRPIVMAQDATRLEPRIDPQPAPPQQHSIVADTRRPLQKATAAIGRSRVYDTFIAPVMDAIDFLGGGTEAGFLGAMGGPAVRLPQVTKVLAGGRIAPTTFTGGNTRIALERALQSASPAELVSYIDDIGTGIVRKYGALENLPRNTPESFAISWLQVRGVRQLAELADKGDQAAAAAVARFVPEHQAFQAFKEISKGLQKEENVALGLMTSARLQATTTVPAGAPIHIILEGIIQQGNIKPLHVVQGRGRVTFDNALRNMPSKNLGLQLDHLENFAGRGVAPSARLEDAIASTWMYTRMEGELIRRALAGDRAAFTYLDNAYGIAQKINPNVALRVEQEATHKFANTLLQSLIDLGAISP
jgi:hypothetical protein